MAYCKRCREYLPPGFVENDRCIFCTRDLNYVVYEDGAMIIKKEEIIQEYKMLLSEIKGRNEILRKTASGDMSDISKKLVLD